MRAAVKTKTTTEPQLELFAVNTLRIPIYETTHPIRTDGRETLAGVPTIRSTLSRLDAGIIFDPLNLLAPQTVSFQRLIENLRRDKEIGLPQLRDGIGKFYQLFFSSQFEQADGANNDRQTQLARRFASIPVVH